MPSSRYGSHRARYSHHHRRLRRIAARQVEAGLATCARCGRPIQPTDRWDLGHREGGGPLEYAGLEHSSCNRANNVGGQRRTSRDW